jgi:hypothetical protein
VTHGKKKPPPPGRRRSPYKSRWEVPGWLYALPYCGPQNDMVRIGHTHSPTDRAASLRREWPYRDGIARPLTVYAIQVENRLDAHRKVVAALDGASVNDLETTKRIISETLGGEMEEVQYTMDLLPMPRPKYRSHICSMPRVWY